MVKVKDKLVRRHIHWRDVLFNVGIPELEGRYWLKFQECKVKRKSIISEDRIAYNVLKSWFGVERLRFYRICGSFY